MSASGADTDRRRALLRAALGFALCRSGVREAGSNRGWPEKDSSWLRTPDPPVLHTLHGWLSTWRGLGLVAAGMARQGYDLSLTRYADLGWRATFYVTGREHSPTGASGSAFEPTAFGAVHRAAWETLARA
jgi:hypothetical protein